VLPSRPRASGKAKNVRARRAALTACAAVALCLLFTAPSPALMSGRSELRARSASSSAVLLGNTSLEPFHARLSADSLKAFGLRARHGGELAAVRVYVDSGTHARAIVLSIYGSRDGAPGSRLASGSLTRPRAGRWDTVKIPKGRLLWAGRNYWLSILALGGRLGYRTGPGACPTATAAAAGWKVIHSSAAGVCAVSAYAVRPSPPANPRSSVRTQTAYGDLPADFIVGAPVNSALPAISGAAVEGSTLKATAGAWSENPTAYGYQWQHCNSGGTSCVAIPGATDASYVVQAAVVGDTLRVVVTARNAAGSSAVTSGQTAVVLTPGPHPPANTAPPTISGAAIEGGKLKASPGAWSESPTSYAYEWQACNSAGGSCAAISGAKTSSYTVAGAVVGDTLRVVVTAHNSAGSNAASSAVTGVVTVPSAACTKTLGPGENVASAVNGAAGGSVVCLTSGSYGALRFETGHSSDVTLEAAAGAHVDVGELAISASHLVFRNLWVDGQIALSAGVSYVTLDHLDITGGSEGVVFDTSNCKAPNAPSWPECEPQAPVTNVTISADHFHDIGSGGSEDAIHLDWWADVTVTGNEFEHIDESGNHTDCLQSVYGGTNLTFTHNYEHDDDCQGFFVKDGDATNVTVADNLFVRDSEGSYANFAQIWNCQNLTVEDNTIWDGKGLALVADEASFAPAATIERNLFQHFTVEKPVGSPYSLTEGENIFGESPSGLTTAKSDAVNANPKFDDTATDDYRLASNPDGIGINWAPAEEQYGPTS
jgi:hypothetical protein